MKKGRPAWFELMAADLAAASSFYASVLGWRIADSGMTGMNYQVAHIGDAMVAGMMAPPDPAIPPHWAIYFAADDCDGTARQVAAAGGRILVAPTDIPGVGRFATLADPQGAVFSILHPAGAGSAAFDQMKTGHGNWTELMTPDPEAALAFYGALFGWRPDAVVPMGETGNYLLFAHEGQAIGGMMGQGQAPVPCWMPYFGVEGTSAAAQRIKSAGGAVIHGPSEVPGGAFIAVARDDQGAHFAVVGPR